MWREAVHLPLVNKYLLSTNLVPSTVWGTESGRLYKMLCTLKLLQVKETPPPPKKTDGINAARLPK